jgi:hypothetical protein
MLCFAAAAALSVWSAAALADGGPQPAAGAAPAHAQRPNPSPPTSHAVAHAAARQPLDLTAPPVNHVLTPEQVQSFIAETDEDTSPPDSVTVKQERYVDPVPSGAFSALPWALLHPLEAWRIFTPITD